MSLKHFAINKLLHKLHTYLLFTIWPFYYCITHEPSLWRKTLHYCLTQVHMWYWYKLPPGGKLKKNTYRHSWYDYDKRQSHLLFYYYFNRQKIYRYIWSILNWFIDHCDWNNCYPNCKMVIISRILTACF